MTRTEQIIAAARARREAQGLNVTLTDTRDGHVTAVSCANAEQLADLRQRASKAGRYTVEGAL